MADRQTDRQTGSKCTMFPYEFEWSFYNMTNKLTSHRHKLFVKAMVIDLFSLFFYFFFLLSRENNAASANSTAQHAWMTDWMNWNWYWDWDCTRIVLYCIAWEAMNYNKWFKIQFLLSLVYLNAGPNEIGSGSPLFTWHIWIKHHILLRGSFFLLVF